jgi:uncharacterized coiled-coil DUF342 family protein
LTTQQIDKIIDIGRQLALAALSAWAFVKAIQEISKERSIGKSALEKLNNDFASIKNECEELKREHKGLSEDIDEIQEKYEKFFEKILNNFPFKQ